MFSFVFQNSDSDNKRLYIIWILMSLGLVILAWRQQRQKITYLWKYQRKTFLWNALRQLLLGFVISLISHLLLFNKGLIDLPINQKKIESNIRGEGDLALLAFQVLILAPIVEEVIFRWLIFEIFGKNTFSIIISALSFGLAHWYGKADSFQAIFYILSGFSFAYIYHESNYNLVYPITLHFINNLIAFTFMIFRFYNK